MHQQCRISVRLPQASFHGETIMVSKSVVHFLSSHVGHFWLIKILEINIISWIKPRKQIWYYICRQSLHAVHEKKVWDCQVHGCLNSNFLLSFFFVINFKKLTFLVDPKIADSKWYEDLFWSNVDPDPWKILLSLLV